MDLIAYDTIYSPFEVKPKNPILDIFDISSDTDHPLPPFSIDFEDTPSPPLNAVPLLTYVKFGLGMAGTFKLMSYCSGLIQKSMEENKKLVNSTQEYRDDAREVDKIYKHSFKELPVIGLLPGVEGVYVRILILKKSRLYTQTLGKVSLTSSESGVINISDYLECKDPQYTTMRIKAGVLKTFLNGDVEMKKVLSKVKDSEMLTVKYDLYQNNTNMYFPGDKPYFFRNIDSLIYREFQSAWPSICLCLGTVGFGFLGGMLAEKVIRSM